jgi:hypothetical protein
MVINNRTVSLVEYRTDRNWLDQLPQREWLCVLVAEEKRRTYANEVVAKLVLRDVAWVCAVGAAGEWMHDLLDEEIVFREVEALYLPPHDIMTTWHDEVEECLWFALYAAHDETVLIDHVAVLDMTQGAALPGIKAYLETLAAARPA